MVFLLVRDRGVVAERGVAAARVVPALDELEKSHPRLGLRRPPPPVDQLALECGEEALAHRVIKAIADAAERRTYAGLAASGAELSFTEGELKGARGKSDRYGELVGRIRLTDGGIYDNMGLQPVLSERAPTVLVSDGGAPFTRRAPTSFWGEAMRYHSVLQGQIGSLRRSGLFGSFGRETFGGAYWGIGSAVERYETEATGPFEGYSKGLAGGVIARVRTDLDAFGEAEVAVLENHGYTLAEAAIRRHAPGAAAGNALPFAWPHSEWRDEESARQALAQSHRRFHLLGRRWREE